MRETKQTRERNNEMNQPNRETKETINREREIERVRGENQPNSQIDK